MVFLVASAYLEAWKHGELIGKWSYSQLHLQAQRVVGQGFAVLEVLGHQFLIGSVSNCSDLT